MPSVRVRRSRSQYTTLRGEPDGDAEVTIRIEDPPQSRRRTLTSIFHGQPESPSVPAQAQDDDEPQRSSRLRRASTRSRQYDSGSIENRRPVSKVIETIMNSASPRTTGFLRSHRSSEPLVRQTELRGSQADIRIPASDHPGILNSALSVSSRVYSETDEDEDEDEDHHHDDVVEHLDVIDPQIATISNLANAANSILIPPIGVYSRKPVVILPRISVHEDAERKSTHEDDLDRHVEEVLGRRAKFRRTMQGVWAFLKTPMGIFTGIYGFLVAFWGAAIVLFLAKIINLHNPVTQGFWVEISSQIENALFTVTGVGLIPWRLADTYRILRIWHFKRLTKKLRQRAGLPQLYDVDDLPDPLYDPNYVHVLTDKQQEELHHLQQAFMKSQTWYRPHGTETHRAFPINTALIICFFIDGNSIFQCVLCGTMWGLNRFQRPAWSTGILIPLSFLCGILSAVFIWRGGQQTKRTKEVEERLRQALAMEKDPISRRKHLLYGDAEISILPPTEAPTTSSGSGRLDTTNHSEVPTVTVTDETDAQSSIMIDEKLLISEEHYPPS